MPPTNQELYLKELQTFAGITDLIQIQCGMKDLAYFAQLVSEKNEM